MSGSYYAVLVTSIHVSDKNVIITMSPDGSQGLRYAVQPEPRARKEMELVDTAKKKLKSILPSDMGIGELVKELFIHTQ